MQHILQQEVDEAVKKMTEGKVPGPEGFMVNFFHHFWDMVKEEVLKIVEDSRISQHIHHAFNATFVTLVTKEVGVDIHDKFRPIALCNVIYKIISKVIANHLKPLLPRLIILEQSGFVEKR